MLLVPKIRYINFIFISSLSDDVCSNVFRMCLIVNNMIVMNLCNLVMGFNYMQIYYMQYL